MALQRNSRSFIRTIGLYFKEVDLPLFATVVAISLFSVLNMYGIDGFGIFLMKQVIFVVVGLGIMILFSFFNYRYL